MNKKRVLHLFFLLFVFASSHQSVSMSLELAKLWIATVCNIVGILTVVVPQIPVIYEKIVPESLLSSQEKIALLQIPEQNQKALEIHQQLTPLLADTPCLERSKELDQLIQAMQALPTDKINALDLEKVGVKNSTVSSNLQSLNVGIGFQASTQSYATVQAQSNFEHKRELYSSHNSISDTFALNRSQPVSNSTSIAGFNSLVQQGIERDLKQLQIAQILANQEVAEKVLEHTITIERVFTNAAGYSSDIKNLKAQLELLQSPQNLPGFLQNYVDQAEDLLLNILVDNKGHFKGIFKEKDYIRAQEAIKSLVEVTGALKSTLGDVLNGVPKDIYLSKITNINPNPQGVFRSWGHGLSSMVGKSLPPDQLRQKFFSHEKYHTVFQAIDAVEKKDFHTAQQKLEEIKINLIPKHKGDYRLHETTQFYYETEYSKYYDAYGLKKVFANDPIYKQFAELIKNAETVEQRKELQAAAELQLTIRDVYYHKIIKQLHVKGEIPEAVHEYAYKLIPIGNDGSKIRELLCTLSADSLDPAQKIAYPYFFDEQGMIRLFDYKKENLLGITFPPSIHSAEFNEIRFLRNKFTSIIQSNEEIKEQVRRGLLDLQAALQNPSLAQKLSYLAQKRFDALINSHNDPTILSIGNFSSYSSPFKQQINTRLVSLTHDMITKSERMHRNPNAFSVIDKKLLSTTLGHINNAQSTLAHCKSEDLLISLPNNSTIKIIASLFAAKKLLEQQSQSPKSICPPNFEESPEMPPICPSENLEHEKTVPCGLEDPKRVKYPEEQICSPQEQEREKTGGCTWSKNPDLPPLAEEKIEQKEKVDLKDIIGRAIKNKQQKATIVVDGKTIKITIPQDSEKIVETLKKFNIEGYNLSTEEKEILVDAIKYLKHVPGALNKDGPLTKVLELGKENSSNNKGTIKGALYELEKALELIKNGEEIIAFGLKINNGESLREFDIITQNKLIECKNIDWNKCEDAKKSIFGQQKNIAKSLNKVFEIHSKKLIQINWKNWFKSNEFNFYEDSSEHSA